MAEHNSGESHQALVVGANGGIGHAVLELWAADERFDRVWAVSRSAVDTQHLPRPVCEPLTTFHDPADISEIGEKICADSPRLSRVVIALGTLHGEDYEPEKSLDALDPRVMQEVYRVNCVLPLLWLAALARGLRKNPDCRVAILSARVGSIADNQLGGWYSYRSAKAGLNMGMRSAAIELARRAKGVKLIAFHPGTVDTALSEPFQRGVPEGKLFSPGFVAGQLDGILEQHAADGALSYLDWAGKTIPW